MNFLFKISLAFIFSLPIIGYTDWDEDKICLQTLICDTNGAFLKDNEDNKACIGSALAAGVTFEKQENDVQPRCLSRQTISQNPQIDFQENRIDNLPPIAELPKFDIELPEFGPIGVAPKNDLGARQLERIRKREALKAH